MTPSTPNEERRLRESRLKEFLSGQYSRSDYIAFTQFVIARNPKVSRFSDSLRIKTSAITHFKDEILSQYEKAIEERREFERTGFSDGKESMILLIKFETFLNSIYSLCDNLSYIGSCFHPTIKRGFNDQRKSIPRYRDIYSKYNEYFDVLDPCSWYDIIHLMRTESTHYLPGFVFHSEHEDLGILYQNMIHSNEKVEINNIKLFTNSIFGEVNAFLEDYGKYFLREFVTADTKIMFYCLIPNPDGQGFLIGQREVSYEEYKNGDFGQCLSSDVPCPESDICPALNH